VAGSPGARYIDYLALDTEYDYDRCGRSASNRRVRLPCGPPTWTDPRLVSNYTFNHATFAAGADMVLSRSSGGVPKRFPHGAHPSPVSSGIWATI